MQFSGAIDDLKQLIEDLGLPGHWMNEGVLHVYSADNGARLNWWPATGLLVVQGKPASAQELQTQLEAKLAIENTGTPADLKLVIECSVDISIGKRLFLNRVVQQNRHIAVGRCCDATDSNGAHRSHSQFRLPCWFRGFRGHPLFVFSFCCPPNAKRRRNA